MPVFEVGLPSRFSNKDSWFELHELRIEIESWNLHYRVSGDCVMFVNDRRIIGGFGNASEIEIPVEVEVLDAVAF
jgi:hypothetical protein